MSLGRRIRTAIVGGGQGCAGFLRMVQEDTLGRFQMEILGVADVNPDAPGMVYAREIGVELVTTSYRELFEIENLDLLIELTGSYDVRDELELTRPRHTRLIDHFGARLFWDVHQAEEAIIQQRTELRARVEHERERIAQIYDSIPDEIVVVDTDMVIQHANASFLRNNNLKMGEVRGCYCYDVRQEVRGDCQVAVENCPFFKALNEKQPTSLVRKHFDKEGNPRYAAIVAAPLLDHAGEVEGIIEMTRDITNRILLEEELRATEVQLEQFMERAPLATHVKNRQGQYVEVNPAFLELFGRSKNEVVGRTDLEILPRDAAEVLRAGDRMVVKEGKEVSYDAELRLRGESVFLSTITYPILDASGAVSAICGLTRDITAQKEMEAELTRTREHLQNILDNAPVIVITTDLESRIVSFNKFAEERLGYRIDELIGKHAKVLYRDPEDRDPLAEAVERHGYVHDYETKLVAKDGTTVPVSITLSQLKDSYGNTIGLVGISRDISRRKALMDQIIQADRLAAVGRLAAGVAHEINNPLAVIGEIAGYLEDMLLGEVDSSSEQLEAELREGLPKIGAQVTRCRSITRRLLSFARKTEARVEVADIVVALDEILPFLEKEARLARVVIHREYPADLPKVNIEEVQLEEVLINLVKNAIQAVGSNGGGNIWVGAQAQEDRVVIVVRDDGPGMPEEVRRRIFDPFFSTKAPGEGTGLGLSICYGIVKRYDGEIRVASSVGEGAAFRVILKIQRPLADAEA